MRRGGQAVFLLVEFAGVALEQGALFGGAFESFHIFAETVLILGDLGDFAGAGGDLLVEGGRPALWGVERRVCSAARDCRGCFGVDEEQAELVFGLVDESDVVEVVVALADFEVGGFAGFWRLRGSGRRWGWFRQALVSDLRVQPSRMGCSTITVRASGAALRMS